MTPAEARAWYERRQARAADQSGRRWIIEAEGRLVCGVGIDSLKWTDRKAYFVIGMFAPSYMGRGLGTEATPGGTRVDPHLREMHCVTVSIHICQRRVTDEVSG
jgi:hypothetical protein